MNQNQNQSQNPNMQDPLVNMESCLNRSSLAILFHRKDYPLSYVTNYFFPSDTSEAQIRKALLSDGRFCLTDTEDGEMVGRINISEEDQQVRLEVEEWKDNMSAYFRENIVDVKLCMLSQIVKRTEGIPKSLKLIDILNSDPQRRFLLITSCPSLKGDDVVVKYKHTPTEVEHYHEEWRKNVAAFLLQQPMPIPLVTVGTHVIKPKNLGKNQKLIDVVKLDTLNRFKIQVDASHNSLTRLSVTPEYCCEYWRQQIYVLWCSSSSEALADVDLSRAPRPAALPRQYTARDMVLRDPRQRFRRAVDFHQLEQNESLHVRMTQQHQQQPHQHAQHYPAASSHFPRPVPTQHPHGQHTGLVGGAGGRGGMSGRSLGYSPAQHQNQNSHQLLQHAARVERTLFQQHAQRQGHGQMAPVHNRSLSPHSSPRSNVHGGPRSNPYVPSPPPPPAHAHAAYLPHQTSRLTPRAPSSSLYANPGPPGPNYGRASPSSVPPPPPPHAASNYATYSIAKQVQGRSRYFSEDNQTPLPAYKSAAHKMDFGDYGTSESSLTDFSDDYCSGAGDDYHYSGGSSTAGGRSESRTYSTGSVSSVGSDPLYYEEAVVGGSDFVEYAEIPGLLRFLSEPATF